MVREILESQVAEIESLFNVISITEFLETHHENLTFTRINLIAERDYIEALYKENPTKELRLKLKIARGKVLKASQQITKLLKTTSFPN